VRFILAAGAMKVADDLKIPPIDEVNSIDDIAEAFIAHPLTKGLSIGVYDNGKINYYNYGVQSKSKDGPPSEGSIYEIASISKTFTGTLLAMMVQEGKVKYDDPISKYLDKDLVNWPDSLAITLEELATHSSGFPKLPTNAIVKSLLNLKDPYKNYKPKHLNNFLKTYTPKPKDKRTKEYSNLGMGLLGNILADVEGTDFNSLVENKILKPLVMNDSYSSYNKSKTQIKGHNGKAKTTPPWRGTTLAGAGSIRSNAQDMMKYIQANLETEGPYAEAHKIRGEFDENRDIGLAWIIIHPKKYDGDLLFHNGGSGGFRTALYIDKAKKRGVIVLNNTIQGVDAIGSRIMQLLAKKDAPSEMDS